MLEGQDWGWPEDSSNPLSHLTLLSSLDLSANELTHLGCDVLASMRSLSELVIADNFVTDLGDVSLRCAGLRLNTLDVSQNRLTQLVFQSLTGLAGLQQLDARSNPLQCQGDDACVARREFRDWLNNTARHLTLVRHPDDVDDLYACQDSGTSYISGRLDCDDKPPLTVTSEQSSQHHYSRQHTSVILVAISALTVVIVATVILIVGLLAGHRYWRTPDVDYCKRRQSQLLQHDRHHQLDADDQSSSLQTAVMTWLCRCCSTQSSMSSVGYRQVIAAELDVTASSSSADVNAVTSSS